MILAITWSSECLVVTATDRWDRSEKIKAALYVLALALVAAAVVFLVEKSMTAAK